MHAVVLQLSGPSYPAVSHLLSCVCIVYRPLPCCQPLLLSATSLAGSVLTDTCTHMQALRNLLSALADIEDSNMSADEIRQLLNIPDKSSKAAAAAAAAAAAPSPSKQVQANQRQQQQQQLGCQQQQQQQQSQQQARPGNSSSSSRSVSPDSLQATARQLGQLSPELAQEWHDRALRQGLEQVSDCCRFEQQGHGRH